ncbi:MAG: hypothetical protein KC912_05510 [Proteobacteria bacterium]|nr:hypothetical protein [Pseudomonadota bacterium]
MFRTTLILAAFAFGTPALATPAPPAPGASARPPTPPARAPRGDRATIDEMMHFLAENAPDAHERMQKLRRRVETPEERAGFRQKLTQTVRRTKADLKDPERAERRRAMSEKERAIRQLAEGVNELPKAEQKKRRAELEPLVAELFDLRQEERKLRLAEAQARIEALEAEIAERDAERESRIDAFVDGLMNPMPEL